MTALQLLPRVLAAMNEMMTDGPYAVGEVFRSIYINGGLHRIWPIISTVGADEGYEGTGVALCILPHEDLSTHEILRAANNAQSIAAWCNALPGTIELMESWTGLVELVAEDMCRDQVLKEALSLAQRILDAIRTGMGAEAYDAMVAKIEQGEMQ